MHKGSQAGHLTPPPEQDRATEMKAGLRREKAHTASEISSITAKSVHQYPEPNDNPAMGKHSIVVGPDDR